MRQIEIFSLTPRAMGASLTERAALRGGGQSARSPSISACVLHETRLILVQSANAFTVSTHLWARRLPWD